MGYMNNIHENRRRVRIKFAISEKRKKYIISSTVYCRKKDCKHRYIDDKHVTCFV